MQKTFYHEIKTWIYRNARHVDLCLWQYFFENGEKEAVADALLDYQNEDGGFGHVLEPDNWNPNSTPTSTDHALGLLRRIGFDDMNHPVYQGIWKYLNAEKDLAEYGWRFTVAGNDFYPHAPWWNYSEEMNRRESLGVTANFSAFILKYGDPESPLYQKALEFTHTFLDRLTQEMSYGEMGLEGYIVLLDAVREMKPDTYDCDALTKVLGRKIKRAIGQDPSVWEQYGVRPSNYINSPDSVFYQDNAEMVEKELQYLLDTKPKDGVWGITWTWFDNMAQYGDAFILSENWWKAIRAILNTLFLKNFGKL
ncbi:hypothetical protein [Eubacterium sp. 1001713B170207_170306_E7]|uniref:hypothetical protein n=1 Tax=Eubacterium sp. 1001713B170207_170306_E7 TaxID=2787097 RepID=UPI00189B06C1|nr:hypothetical protein [Eubacterium sp. 1001713B170207_170306_E7]